MYVNIRVMCSRTSVKTFACVYLREGIRRGQQDVLRFQVTVNNVLKVQVPQCYKNLGTELHKKDMKVFFFKTTFESGMVTCGNPKPGVICTNHHRTCVMRNLVSLSGSLPFSLERIISSMSPWSFSITTNTFSGVSNMHSRFTMPKWRKPWRRVVRGKRTGQVMSNVWKIGWINLVWRAEKGKPNAGETFNTREGCHVRAIKCVWTTSKSKCLHLLVNYIDFYSH